MICYSTIFGMILFQKSHVFACASIIIEYYVHFHVVFRNDIIVCMFTLSKLISMRLRAFESCGSFTKSFSRL